MNSLQLAGSEKRGLLAEKDMPKPKPEAGEVLVRVRAAGITITELQWYPASHTRDGSGAGARVLR